MINKLRRGEFRVGEQLAADIARCLSPDEHVIDFDPYSSDDANEIVQAKKFATPQTDSNRNLWPQCKNVFFHPEYGRSELPKAVNSFLSNYRKNRFQTAIIVVPNSTDAMWFTDLIAVTQNICLVNNRGRHAIFYSRPGEISKHTRGWIIMSVGITFDHFSDCFNWYGTCCANIV